MVRSASVAASRTPATSSLAPPKAVDGSDLLAQRPDDGFLRIGMADAQRSTDILAVDDLFDEPRVQRCDAGSTSASPPREAAATSLEVWRRARVRSRACSAGRSRSPRGACRRRSRVGSSERRRPCGPPRRARSTRRRGRAAPTARCRGGRGRRSSPRVRHARAARRRCAYRIDRSERGTHRPHSTDDDMVPAAADRAPRRIGVGWLGYLGLILRRPSRVGADSAACRLACELLAIWLLVNWWGARDGSGGWRRRSTGSDPPDVGVSRGVVPRA